jgi:hypothetical protein
MHDTKERLSLFWIFAFLNYLYADVLALWVIVGSPNLADALYRQNSERHRSWLPGKSPLLVADFHWLSVGFISPHVHRVVLQLRSRWLDHTKIGRPEVDFARSPA